MTARLTLRPLETADIDALHQLMSDPEVRQYYPNTDPPPRERVELWLDRKLEAWAALGFGVWGVEGTGRPVPEAELMGWSGLQYLAETDEVEVAYSLCKPYWGNGYASEAAAAGLAFGFDTVGLDRIIGIIHPANHRSQRVLEKLGMKLVDRNRYFNLDVLRYAIERREYEELRPERRSVEKPRHAGR